MEGDATGLAATLHHLASFFAVRDRPNVILLHYADLKEELEGQMRRLAARLSITVPEERWPALVRPGAFHRGLHLLQGEEHHHAQADHQPEQGFFRMKRSWNVGHCSSALHATLAPAGPANTLAGTIEGSTDRDTRRWSRVNVATWSSALKCKVLLKGSAQPPGSLGDPLCRQCRKTESQP